MITDLSNTFCFSNRIPRLPCVLLRERLEGASGISSVKTHKRKFKATVSIPDVVEPVELSSQQINQDLEAEAANIEPVPAPAAAGSLSARTSPAKAVKVSAKETDGNTSPSPGKASGKPKTAPAPAPPGKGRRGGAGGAR